MSRIESEALSDPENIFLAASLRVARKVEALLTSRGVDYAVEVEELGRTAIFGSVRHGAAFYVAAGQASYCRVLLGEAGYSRGIVEDQQHDAD